MRATGDKRTPWLHRTLLAQGLILLVFVILHLITFKYGPHYSVDYGKGEIRDLFKLMVEVFQQRGYVAWFFFFLFFLMGLFSLGFVSILNSLVFFHPLYTPLKKNFGRLYAFIVVAGFIA